MIQRVESLLRLVTGWHRTPLVSDETEYEVLEFIELMSCVQWLMEAFFTLHAWFGKDMPLD